MSVTYVEQIPPIDEMPDWAQEAFHSSNFFRACINKVSSCERQIRNLQREVDDLYSRLDFTSEQPPVSDELRQAALRLIEHAKKMPPHAQIEHSRMVANYLIDDLSAALQEGVE